MSHTTFLSCSLEKLCFQDHKNFFRRAQNCAIATPNVLFAFSKRQHGILYVNNNEMGINFS